MTVQSRSSPQTHLIEARAVVVITVLPIRTRRITRLLRFFLLPRGLRMAPGVSLFAPTLLLLLSLPLLLLLLLPMLLLPLRLCRCRCRGGCYSRPATLPCQVGTNHGLTHARHASREARQ